MKPFTYQRPFTVQEALHSIRNTPGSIFLAGGTNLVDMMKLEVINPSVLIDINQLPLNKIEPLPNGGIQIGSLVRNSDLGFHPLIRKNYPVLSQAVLSGASPQLRNMATVGGNLMQKTRCSYYRDEISPCSKRNPGSGCSALKGYHAEHAILGTSSSCIATHPSDMCVALSALEAIIHIESEKGKRKIAASEFHLLPGNSPEKETVLEPYEIIVMIELPPLPPNTTSCYIKVSHRALYEFALSSAAVVLEWEGEKIKQGRIALGGVAAKPWRCFQAERLLENSLPDEKLFRSCAETALQGAEPQKENQYKVELTKQVICKALSTAFKRSV